jgi:hypothetical protein
MDSEMQEGCLESPNMVINKQIVKICRKLYSEHLALVHNTVTGNLVLGLTNQQLIVGWHCAK